MVDMVYDQEKNTESLMSVDVKSGCVIDQAYKFCKVVEQQQYWEDFCLISTTLSENKKQKCFVGERFSKRYEDTKCGLDQCDINGSPLISDLNSKDVISQD